MNMLRVWWMGFALCFSSTFYTASATDLDYPMDNDSIRQQVFQLAPLALQDNHPEALRILFHFLRIKEISKGWVMQRLTALSSNPKSCHRFMATTMLCHPEMPAEYQRIGHVNLLKMAWDYGGKDQYESADFLLTYGDWLDQWHGQQSLRWIMYWGDTCREESILSLWINGNEWVRDSLRPFIKRYALSEEIGSPRFLEALYYHGNDSDRAYVNFFHEQFEVVEHMDVEG